MVLKEKNFSESLLRIALISELIKAHQEQGISQKKLEELSGVKQPIISRMKKRSTSPQLDTFLKVLTLFGKTRNRSDRKVIKNRSVNQY